MPGLRRRGGTWMGLSWASTTALRAEYAWMIELDSASDASLVVAIARWHGPALAEVYRRHGGVVNALARRVTGAQAAADDVTQDVFVALWEHPERFDPTRGSLRSFLLAVTHSRSVDLLRAHGARRAREERDARSVATDGYDLERHAWDLHVGNQVRRAIACLPEPERQAIELAYFGGHTYREVASMLVEPEGTIKSRIRSALGRLRQALEREGAHL